MKQFMMVLIMISSINTALLSMEATKSNLEATEERENTVENENKEFLELLSQIPRELRKKVVSEAVHSKVAQYELVSKIRIQSCASLAFSSDEAMVLIGGYSGEIVLYDLKKDKPIHNLGYPHTRQVASVAFSPDDTTFLTASLDGTALLWDVVSGKQLKQFTGPEIGIRSVAFNPDGKTILVGRGDGTVVLWNVESGEELKQFVADDTGRATSVAFSPDGKAILVLRGGRNGKALLWNVETGEQLQEFAEKGQSINSVVFSSDGKRIIMGLGNGQIITFDAFTGKKIKATTLSSESFYDLPYISEEIFSPTRRTALTLDNEGVPYLWDADTGKLLQVLRGEQRSDSVPAFSPKGTFIAIPSNSTYTLSIWKFNPAFIPEKKEKAVKTFLESGYHKILEEAPQGEESSS